MRTFLGVVMIGVGLLNLRLPHPWHRVLGAVAILIGLALCVLVWLR